MSAEDDNLIEETAIENTEDLAHTPDAPSFYGTGIFTDENKKDLLETPAKIGKYRILDKLGAGGVGSVYRAEHEETGQTVALKLLHRGVIASDYDVQRFKKESRMQAKLNSPYVTSLIEFGEHHGLHFIASEYVKGTDLRELLPKLENSEPLISLLIIRDVLTALDEMHQQSMMHRDIKPANIILVHSELAEKERIEVGDFEKAKLTDFGLARQVDQSESLALTQASSMLGTPLYVSPEQIAEAATVNAAADIYSVGATLYHLLTGRPPFMSKDRFELAEMHRSERAAPLHEIDSKFGDAVSNLVAKALEKHPAMRYRDASEMLEDLDRILKNQPTLFRSYVTADRNADDYPQTFRFQWEMESSVERLWPLVSDTNRFNQAIGLPTPNYDFDGKGAGRKVIATANYNGLKLEWREHPFQWIQEREFAVLREFATGPFKAVSSNVILEPRSDGKSLLTHEFKVQPRGILGRWFSLFQFRWATKRAISKAYKRIDELAQQNDSLVCDASFTSKPAMSNKAIEKLQLLGRKLTGDFADSKLIERFLRYLSEASDSAVSRMRPIELASRFKCDQDLFLELCVKATKHQIVDMGWDIICPTCRIATRTETSLAQIEQHVYCELCDLQVDVDFAKNVELLFSVSPQLRKVETRNYCIGGPYHLPHIIAQNILSSQDIVDIPVRVYEGAYEVRSPQLNRSQTIMVENGSESHFVDIDVPGEDVDSQTNLNKIAVGESSVRLRNVSDANVLCRVSRMEEHRMALTATECANHPLLSKLFPSEFKSVHDLAQIVSGFILTFHIKNYDELVDELGEVRAAEFLAKIQDELKDNNISHQLVDQNPERFSFQFDTIDGVSSAIKAFDLSAKDCTPNPNAAFVLVSGELVAKGPSNNRVYMGKSLRKSQRQCEKLEVNQLAIENSLVKVDDIRSAMNVPTETKGTFVEGEFFVVKLDS